MVRKKLFEINVGVYIWQLCQRGKFEKALRIERLMLQWNVAAAEYRLANYQELEKKFT